MAFIRKKKTQKANALNAFAEGIRNDLAVRGSDLGGQQIGGLLVSAESLSGAQAEALSMGFESARSMIRDHVSSLGLENIDPEGAGEEIPEESLDAAAAAAVASQDPAAYAEKALNSEPTAVGDGVNVIEPVLAGANGSVDTVNTVATEAYNDRNLREAAHYSVAFNLSASRQSEFGEAFFPTLTVSPEQGAVDVEVELQRITSGWRHSHTGRYVDTGKVNLIRAFMDHTVLADNSTDVVPHVASDDSNAHCFVDKTLVAPYNVNVGGVAVTTAPLKCGEQVSLLGLSSHPSLLGTGVLNETDDLDGRVALRNIYLKTSDNKALRFDTTNLSRSHFQKSVEGTEHELALTFQTKSLFIDKNTRAVDNSETTDLSQLPVGAVVRIQLHVNGTVDVETSNTIVTGSFIRVVEIVGADGAKLDLKSGAGQAVTNAIQAMKIEGYDLDTRRSNANQRTRGKVLDTTVITERYRIPLCAPITVQSPVNSNKDAAALKSLINAARAANAGDAVTTLLNYADSLRNHLRGPRFQDVGPEILGAGRYYVEPFFEHHTLDVLKSLNAVKSHEKAWDVQAAIVNPLRDIAGRMVRNSNYLAALECLSGGSSNDFELLVGTDHVIAQQLMVTGDNRTFGDQFKNFSVVTSNDQRMRNKIVMTLRRKGSTGQADPLSFGVMAWIPELTTTIDAPRDGGISREVRVTPRKLHLPLLPVMAVIDVENLSAALANKIDGPATASAVGDHWTKNVRYK